MRSVRILVPVAMLGLLSSAVSAQTLDDMSDPGATQPTSSSPLDKPIETIADSTGGCAVLDKDFPGLRAHPMYAFFKSMTLNQIAAMSKGQITPDMLAQANTDLAALTPVNVAQAPAALAVASPIKATPVSATVAVAH
jgi:hypothetical protein